MGDNLARRGSDIYYSQSDAVLRLLPASRNEAREILYCEWCVSLAVRVYGILDMSCVTSVGSIHDRISGDVQRQDARSAKFFISSRKNLEQARTYSINEPHRITNLSSIIPHEHNSSID